MKAYS
jgi:ABC-type multidrug transport system fused ATPase/permease subunit